MNSNSLVSLLPIILIILVFYLFIIRPNQNRQRAAAQMRNELAPGAEVKTIGGLFATVSAVEDDVLTLEIAPGVHARFDKRAVAAVVAPSADATTGPAHPALGAGDAARADAAPSEQAKADEPGAKPVTGTDGAEDSGGAEKKDTSAGE